MHESWNLFPANCSGKILEVASLERKKVSEMNWFECSDVQS